MIPSLGVDRSILRVDAQYEIARIAVPEVHVVLRHVVALVENIVDAERHLPIPIDLEARAQVKNGIRPRAYVYARRAVLELRVAVVGLRAWSRRLSVQAAARRPAGERTG